MLTFSTGLQIWSFHKGLQRNVPKRKTHVRGLQSVQKSLFLPLYMQIGKVLVAVNVVIADKVPILHPHALTFLD